MGVAADPSDFAADSFAEQGHSMFFATKGHREKRLMIKKVDKSRILHGASPNAIEDRLRFV